MNIIEEERASYIMKTPNNKNNNSNKDSNENSNVNNQENTSNNNNNKTLNNSLIKNFNHKFFELEEPRNIMTNKKGCWYSLDYIKSHNYIVCGYENGEILIFKEFALSFSSDKTAQNIFFCAAGQRLLLSAVASY